jgi:hypothetical protein
MKEFRDSICGAAVPDPVICGTAMSQVTAAIDLVDANIAQAAAAANTAAATRAKANEAALGNAMLFEATLTRLGKVIITHDLNKFEKAPKVIYQKLGQFVEMDTDAARPNASFDPGTTGLAGAFTHNEGPGQLEQSGQAVWYEFWGLSGPNFQAEEGHDPYTWIMCGSRGEVFAEEGCNANEVAQPGGGVKGDAAGTALDAHGFVIAIVKPPSTNLGGLDVFRRYGNDLRPSTGVACNGTGDDDPAICGEPDVVVFCSKTTTGDILLSNGETVEGDKCESNPGADGVYGTGDDGTIYYREAQENGLRGFVRENRAHAFSFINGIGVNHPDLCGDLTLTFIDADGDPDTGDNGKEVRGVTTPCGDSPSTGTRQVMFQNIQDLGATLSCFNCSALGQHTVPDHGFDRYNFKWTPLPGVHIPEDHPETNGNIPEGGGQPSNNF